MVFDYGMYGEYVNDKEREIREDIVRISEILDLNLGMKREGKEK